LPTVSTNGTGDSEYDRWYHTNVRNQRQAGYAMVTIRVDQGNLTADQMRGVARIAADAGDGLIRVLIDQNLLLGFVPLGRVKRAYTALGELGLNGAGASEIQDVTTCPGAYSCNLGLTKSMNLGAALQQTVREYDDALVRNLSIKISGCPNSCGQHWIADFGFYGNARKVDGREIPYYQMLLGGGYDRDGVMRFGLAVQSIPARSCPRASPPRILPMRPIATRAPRMTSYPPRAALHANWSPRQRIWRTDAPRACAPGRAAPQRRAARGGAGERARRATAEDAGGCGAGLAP
jgi:hypothetical protein